MPAAAAISSRPADKRLWRFAGQQRLPYFAGQPYAQEEELPSIALQQVREETYTNTGTAESPVFVPLDEVGEDF